MTVVSPITTPVPWSMKKFRPIFAPGWMSIPVLACAHSVIILAFLYSALILVSPLYLIGQFGIDFIKDVAEDKFDVCSCDNPIAGMAREEDLEEQVEYFEYLAPYGQI